MPGDPLGASCGCALTLAVFAGGVAIITVWAYLNETGLIYPLALGLALWLTVSVVRRVHRWSNTERT
jgi:hypothetical protein